MALVCAVELLVHAVRTRWLRYIGIYVELHPRWSGVESCTGYRSLTHSRFVIITGCVWSTARVSLDLHSSLRIH